MLPLKWSVGWICKNKKNAYDIVFRRERIINYKTISALFIKNWEKNMGIIFTRILTIADDMKWFLYFYKIKFLYFFLSLDNCNEHIYYLIITHISYLFSFLIPDRKGRKGNDHELYDFYYMMKEPSLFFKVNFSLILNPKRMLIDTMVKFLEQMPKGDSFYLSHYHPSQEPQT